jgi:hypothetical protein
MLSAASLALRARGSGFSAPDVDSARIEERSIVHTWVMRGTLHLIASDDVVWLLPLMKPANHADAHRALKHLGIESHASKALRVVDEVLGEEGPSTRAELAAHLRRRGIPAKGQAVMHLVRLAAIEGIACPGPERGSEQTFVLLRDWVGPVRPLDRERGLAELARRYVGAYGPAEPRDLASWARLSLADARAGWQAIAGELIEVDMNGSRMWTLRRVRLGRSTQRLVRLLPNFDTYLLGYRGRGVTVDDKYAHKVLPGGGWLHPTVIVDGRVMGTWKAERRRGSVAVIIEPFTRLEPQVRQALSAEAADVGRFLGMSAELLIG